MSERGQRDEGESLARDTGVRALEPRDLEAVVSLARELAAHVADPPPALTPAQLATLAGGPHPWFECLVAERSGSVIGYALFQKLFDAHTSERRLFLNDLVVAAAERHTRAGSALLSAVCARGRELGCARIVLEVWRENPDGLRFFEARGARADAEVQVLQLRI